MSFPVQKASLHRHSQRSREEAQLDGVQLQKQKLGLPLDPQLRQRADPRSKLRLSADKVRSFRQVQDQDPTQRYRFAPSSMCQCDGALHLLPLKSRAA